MDPTGRPRDDDPELDRRDDAEIDLLNHMASAEDAGDLIENWAAAHSCGYSDL